MKFFPKWNITFIKFDEFRKSDKLLILNIILVICVFWLCGNILVFYKNVITEFNEFLAKNYEVTNLKGIYW